MKVGASVRVPKPGNSRGRLAFRASMAHTGLARGCRPGTGLFTFAKKSGMRSLNLGLFFLGCGLIAVTIIRQVDPSLGVFAIPATGFFIAIGILPFVPFGVLNRRAQNPVSLWICALALMALSAFWIWGFGSVFWWNPAPDAQDGLALVVLPAVMIAVAGPVAVGVWAIERYL